MASIDDRASIRRKFAQDIMTKAGRFNERVQLAFATVPRENFVGSGPWLVPRLSGYEPTASSNLLDLYDDVPVALIPERNLNNGQPSFHARLLCAANPAVGAHIVHIGAGAGYFSAIMAEIVGPSGKVTAIEYDPDLASRARKNLAICKNIECIHGDGTSLSFPIADVIYVNAGATKPADRWLDALAEGGRLLVPLTAPNGLPETPLTPRGWLGAVLNIERRGTDYFVLEAIRTGIFPCIGGRDEASETALTRAFAGGGIDKVRKLYRHGNLPESACWLRTPTWSLAYH